MKIDFTFSDTIGGYVTHFNRVERSVGISTSDGRQFKGVLTPTTYARISQNLEEGYADATGRLAELLTPGQLVYAYGVFYPDFGEGDYVFEIKSMVFPRHEQPSAPVEFPFKF